LVYDTLPTTGSISERKLVQSKHLVHTSSNFFLWLWRNLAQVVTKNQGFVSLLDKME
jgi:hypothetical protein